MNCFVRQRPYGESGQLVFDSSRYADHYQGYEKDMGRSNVAIIVDWVN